MRADEYLPLYLHVIVLATLVAIYLVEWKRGVTLRTMVVTGACLGTLAVGYGVLASLWVQESRDAAAAARRAAALERANLEFLGEYLARRYGDHRLVIIVNECCDPGEASRGEVAEAIRRGSGGKAAIVAVHHPMEFAAGVSGECWLDLVFEESLYIESRQVLLGRYPAAEVVLDLTQVGAWACDGGSVAGSGSAASRVRVVLGLPPFSTLAGVDGRDDGVDAYLEVRPLPPAPTGAGSATEEFVRRVVELLPPAVPKPGTP